MNPYTINLIFWSQKIIMKYEDYSPVTPKDINLATCPTDIPLIIINEGKLVQENFNQIDIDEKWLMNNLSMKNVDDIREVFLATIDKSKNLYVLKNNTHAWGKIKHTYIFI